MQLRWQKRFDTGFTLLEIMVVIAIISLLAVVVVVGLGGSSAKSRDAKRQTDLRNLQTAIETYKNREGRYPLGCVAAGAAAGGWSGQLDTNFACTDGNGGQYIVGLAPEYIAVLPTDPKLNGVDSGYIYRTNTTRTVYKLMALNTVESELVDYNHALRSCDIRPDNIGRLQNLGPDAVDTAGWCKIVATGGAAYENIPARCRMSTGINASDGGNGRFERSYGVWGGFEPVASGATKAAQVRNTTAVICK